MDAKNYALSNIDEKIWIDNTSGDLKYTKNQLTKIVISGLRPECMIWKHGEKYVISAPNIIKSIQLEIHNSLACNVKEIDTPNWIQSLFILYDTFHFSKNDSWLTVYFRYNNERITLSLPLNSYEQFIDSLEKMELHLIGSEKFLPIMRSDCRRR